MNRSTSNAVLVELVDSDFAHVKYIGVDGKYKLPIKDLAVAKGCSQEVFCYREYVIDGYGVQGRIAGVFPGGDVVVQSTETFKNNIFKV